MDDARQRLLDIGEVAERAGLAPSALRFYERKGLISPADRAGLRRVYAPDVLDTLALISAARAAGFALAEIAELLAARPGDRDLRRRLAAKADQLDQRITQLTAMRDSLRHATACRHAPLTTCPHFLRSIRAT
ncbi:MerR family transcriptional regulator [Actinomadura violacea]|uniref:MerR family transcriptional regulator n=1 Tax=Actinomadura violacea TaxID=2819934 RepID=A0ABS3S7E2_9ACTN|nr:MerR family transcriptional regulator [Actinomadura violacea]MBO2464921.1 MerR family transcriptional regulator [Actinomadura violacea]